MGTPLGPKYIPYTYMDPLGYTSAYITHIIPMRSPINTCRAGYVGVIGIMEKKMETTILGFRV